MSDKTKTRAVASNQSQKVKNPEEHSWRGHATGNLSSNRFTREMILEKYTPSMSLPIEIPESLTLLYIPFSAPPSLTKEGFPHGLGDAVNSRKNQPREKAFVKGHESGEERGEEKKKEESLWGDNETGNKHDEHQDKKDTKKFKADKGSRKNIHDAGGEENPHGGKKAHVEEKKAHVDEKKAHADEKKAHVDEKKPHADEKKEHVDEKKAHAEEKKAHAEERKAHAEEKKAHVDHKKVHDEEKKEETLDTKHEFKEAKRKRNKKKKDKGQVEPEDHNQTGPKEQAAPKGSRDAKKGKEQKPNEKKSQPNSKNPEETNKKPHQTKPAEPKKEVSALEKKAILSLAKKENPFAKALLQTGIPGEDQQKIYFPIGSKPYERVWFYKDPNSIIQGPFSCLEMFTWTNHGIFPDHLEISFCNTEFVPMNQYIANRQKFVSEKKVFKNDFPALGEAQDRDIKNPWINHP